MNGNATFDYVFFSTTRTAAGSGYYQSKAFDLGVTPSAKGSISWAETLPGGAKTEMFARSSPNGTTWSGWDGPYATPAGSTINAALNRYVQFSATLTENVSLQSPVLDKVTLMFPGIAPYAPIITSSSHPAGVWGNGAVIDLAWTEPAGNPAPVWAYYYALDAPVLSGTSLAGSAIIMSATVPGASLPGVLDGLHEWQMVAQGEPSQYPLSPLAPFWMRKDTQPPDPVVITSPTHPSVADSANDSPLFNLSSADSLTLSYTVSGVAGYHYVIDSTSGTMPTIADPFTAASAVQLYGLADGTWFFHAKAKDVAGNLGTAGQYPIKISYKGRVTVIITSSTHPENTESVSNSPAFALSVSNPDCATIMGYHYVLDNAAYTRPAASDSFTTATTLNFSGLRNATWYLHASAKNNTGSISNPAHYMFIVNLRGPILDESLVHAVPHPITGRSATIRYELRAPANALITEILDEKGRVVTALVASTSAGRNTMTWDTSNVANGLYFLRMKVTRQDGKENTVIKKLAVTK